MKSFHDGKITLHSGDCLDVLKAMPENSIDAVVTDPPYHLTNNVGTRSPYPGQYSPIGKPKQPKGGFMGQSWDGGDIAFRPELWAEMLRVLKPGGHMVAFSGTRTYHRMAVAIEDAGFEIRDQLAWVYGSGFPKSHDVSKNIDRMAGAEREVVGPKRTPRGELYSSVRQMKPGTMHAGYDRPWKHDSAAVSLANMETAPTTDAARQWEGWGTALKPAFEPICLCRKPLDSSTIAANVLRWGTGALNIDGCRILGEKPNRENTSGVEGMFGLGSRTANGTSNVGRWPANLCHDGSPEVLAGFPESNATNGAFYRRATLGVDSPVNVASRKDELAGIGHGDSGSAARFFYTAKAGQWDRINRIIETVAIEWNTGQEQHLATLPVDTEQLHRKGIVASPSDTSNEWNTFLSGSNISDLCRKASRCTIKTATSSTTTSQTWSWLTRLLTNESIRAANYETANGSSHAETAEISGPSLIITLGETASLPGASLAMSGTQLRISVSAKQHGHPTIKPVSLMQWLVRLVCPKGATVLDPFAGTGTTGAASFIEGRRCVLIEREAEYLADIEKRMGMLLSGSEERSWKLAKPEPLEALPLFALPGD